MKSFFLEHLKSVYKKVYWWITKVCQKSGFIKNNPFIRVIDILSENIVGVSFDIKGKTNRFRRKLPDYFIDDSFQRNFLDKFMDELGGTDWSYTYGVIELENAYISFPFPSHRLRNITIQQGIGDSYDCMCEPRYVFSWLKTFLPPKETLDIGIMITLPLYENYYHWTIEILPRLKMISEDKKFQGIPVILPKNRCPRFITESLILSGFSDRLLFLEDGSYKIKKLVIPTLYSHRSEVTETAVQWLKANILNRPDVAEPETIKQLHFDKIFISRDDADIRKIVNTQEVDDLLSQFGIKKINMSDYSIHEQAIIFNKAKLIVGIHGAGLTNTVYCESNTRLLELFLDGWFTKAFYNLSRFNGMQYGFLLCKNNRNNLVVNINELKFLIEECSKN
jgi:Glycosyltransferase 61